MSHVQRMFNHRHRRRPWAWRLAAAIVLAAGQPGAAAAGDDAPAACGPPRGTGDLGLIVERAGGSVLVVNTSSQAPVARVSGLGDLSHASAVFSRDARYGYVFGRDGGLSKVDLLCHRLAGRVIQAGNSIGGAISQDGRLIAVSNYKPGGVRVFDADSLTLRHDLPASDGPDAAPSKVVGLVDAPGNRFVFSLYDRGEIWVADLSGAAPRVRRFTDVGRQPYDALIDPDGRFYIAGLFGEDGMAALDLWDLDAGVRRIADGYGRGQRQLPVYKMPHLEGWAIAGQHAFVPAVGHHEVLVLDRNTWQVTGRIPVAGQPVFVIARPDGRHVWVNFALPDNDTVQVLDTRSLAIVKTLRPGKGVLHMEFTPRGEHVWLSVRDENRVDVFDTQRLERLTSFEAMKPSGIFFTARAHRTGL